MTRSNVAGYVAGFPIPEVLQGINAFTLGLRQREPKATVKVIWLNEWFNPPREREVAMTLMNQGADVLAFHTGSTAVMAAAEERGARRGLPRRHARRRAHGADCRRHAPVRTTTRRVKAAHDGSWRSAATCGAACAKA